MFLLAFISLTLIFKLLTIIFITLNFNNGKCQIKILTIIVTTASCSGNDLN